MLHGLSFHELLDKLRFALNPGEIWRYYVRELFEDRAIIEEEKSGDLYEVTYAMTEDGSVSLGEPKPVEIEYVAAKYTMVLKDDGTVPTEIQIIPYGHHETDKGPFLLDETGAALVMAAFDAQKNDMVMDYEHQTLYGGEAPASGWITELINKGKEGIWGIVDWTKKAREYIANREYRYVSPVFWKTNDEGRVIELINVALTNQPAIDGMVPIVAKKNMHKKKEVHMEFLKMVLKLLGLPEGTSQGDAMKALQSLQVVAEAHKDVLATLGLKPEASDEEVTAAIVAMKASGPGGDAILVAHRDVLAALGLDEKASLSVVKGTIMAMKQGSDQAGDLAKELADLKARVDGRDADDLVQAAMKAGKVSPAMEEWAKKYATDDPEGFQAFVAKAPVVVPTKEIAGGGGLTGGAGALDDRQLDINKKLGIDQDTFKKHNPEEGDGE